MSLRLLHIADVHLDKPFTWLGERGKEQRRQLKETFRAVVDLALAEHVDALLVAGDLFDSNWPSQDTIDLVRTQLRRLTAPVLILPGTHDCLDDGSIYHKVDLASDAGYVHVFDPEHPAFEFGSLGLTVHGRANRSKTSTTSPLAGITRNTATRYNVALAHGSLLMAGRTDDDFPIQQSEMETAGMDYLALGHWHSYRECVAGHSRACYCGPPELLAENESGFALLVDVSEKGVTVEPRRVAKRRYQKVQVQLDGIGSVEEIRETLRDLRDPDLALVVELVGLKPLDLILDGAEAFRDLSGAFFAFRVVDRSHASLSPEEMATFPEKLVIGQFVRRMRMLIDQASGEDERRLRERALQVGVALLQGRKVLQ